MQKFKEQLQKLLPLISRAMNDPERRKEIEEWAVDFIPKLTEVMLPSHKITLVSKILPEHTYNAENESYISDVHSSLRQFSEALDLVEQ